MIKPHGHNMYIQPLKEVKTIRSANDDSITEKGIISEVGDLVTDFKKGQTVFFNAFLANKVEIEGESFYFVKDSDDEVFATVYEPEKV